jgi:serine/threonine protein kinase
MPDRPNRSASPSSDDRRAPSPAPLGQIGPYALLQKLGQGGMGTVYRAVHLKLKRPVVVKLLAPDRLRDERAVARFQREMEAIGRLDHAHVIRATDAGEAGGQHYLVMEHVEGVDLGRLADRHGPLPVAAACEIVRQAALGLQAIHEQGMVHRDIKPSNLLLTRGGHVKVLDLGLALLYDALPSGDELTVSGQVMGSASYMAPEQGRESHRVDIRADIYSLGCTLYKLLTGQAPFSAYTGFFDKLRAHAELPMPSVFERRPDVPAPLLPILDRLLAKAPADRFAEPRAVAEALAPFAAGANLAELAASVPSTPDGDVVPDHQGATTPSVAGATTHTASADTPATPLAGPNRGRRWWYAVPVALVLGGLGVGAYLATRPSPDLSPYEEPTGSAPAPAPLPPLAPAPAPPPRPGQWQALLDKAPLALRWPHKDQASSWELNAPRQELRVTCTKLGLLQLGHTSAPHYRLEVRIQQAPWVGNFGLFFGHHDDKLAGKACRRYQVIELTSRPAADVGAVFRLGWRSIFTFGPEGLENSSQRPVSKWFRVAPGEHRLAVTVEGAALKSVSWDGGDVPELTAAQAQGPPPARAYRGAFGLYLRQTNGVFHGARYLFREND